MNFFQTILTCMFVNHFTQKPIIEFYDEPKPKKCECYGMLCCNHYKQSDLNNKKNEN